MNDTKPIEIVNNLTGYLDKKNGIAIIRTNGIIEYRGKDITLKQFHEILDGNIEYVSSPNPDDKYHFLCDEEGKIKSKQFNKFFCLLNEVIPDLHYPDKDFVVGDVIVFHKDLRDELLD